MTKVPLVGQKFHTLHVVVLCVTRTFSNMRRVPRDPSPELPPPPVQQPPKNDSSDEEAPQYVTPAQPKYEEPPHHSYSQPPPQQQAPKQPQSLAERDRLDRVSDPAKLPFSQRVSLFKQSQGEQPRQDYKNYIKCVCLFVCFRLSHVYIAGLCATLSSHALDRSLSDPARIRLTTRASKLGTNRARMAQFQRATPTRKTTRLRYSISVLGESNSEHDFSSIACRL